MGDRVVLFKVASLGINSKIDLNFRLEITIEIVSTINMSKGITNTCIMILIITWSYRSKSIKYVILNNYFQLNEI